MLGTGTDGRTDDRPVSVEHPTPTQHQQSLEGRLVLTTEVLVKVELQEPALTAPPPARPSLVFSPGYSRTVTHRTSPHPTPPGPRGTAGDTGTGAGRTDRDRAGTGQDRVQGRSPLPCPRLRRLSSTSSSFSPLPSFPSPVTTPRHHGGSVQGGNGCGLGAPGLNGTHWCSFVFSLVNGPVPSPSPDPTPTRVPGQAETTSPAARGWNQGVLAGHRLPPRLPRSRGRAHPSVNLQYPAQPEVRDVALAQEARAESATAVESESPSRVPWPEGVPVAHKLLPGQREPPVPTVGRLFLPGPAPQRPAEVLDAHRCPAQEALRVLEPTEERVRRRRGPAFGLVYAPGEHVRTTAHRQEPPALEVPPVPAAQECRFDVRHRVVDQEAPRSAPEGRTVVRREPPDDVAVPTRRVVTPLCPVHSPRVAVGGRVSVFHPNIKIKKRKLYCKKTQPPPE